MREVEVPLAPDASLENAESIIEAACAAEGLRLTLKDTLKAYPGCVHWHYKRRDEPGMLEITLWAAKHRLWFKVSAGRQGAWIEEAIERLSAIIRDQLT
jgi:hypothetical protein